MVSTRAVGQRLRRVFVQVIDQGDQLTEPPAYGSWLLGQVLENQRSRRIRIQVILTSVIVFANLVGIGVVLLIAIVAIPAPNVFTDAPLWVTFVVAPSYMVVALVLGTYWITRRTVQTLRWALEERPPSHADARSTFRVPRQVALATATLWGIGAVASTILYGLANPLFIPRFLFTVSICGVLVATGAYLLTEFALRPVAAQALEAAPPPQRFAPGIMGRTMMVWLLGSGGPLVGINLMAISELVKGSLTKVQFAVGIVIVSTGTLIFGFVLMWIMSWLTATPVRVVRAALNRVANGDLRRDLVVFDGTELGELQRGFNTMVDGLRERERVRDLFGRHVGREVAIAAERERPKLGGEERHVAVVFIDIVGSTKLVTSQPPADVVALLNRFFAVVVDEVDRHRGLVNKFAGDASLAIFGAPNHLERPEDQALAAARTIAARLASEVPECRAGIGVAAGQVVAGNIGSKERFEYTVIGEPVNEAARLCELAKDHPGRLLASGAALDGASHDERARWSVGKTVTLRGHDQPTRLAAPI
ncbi:adenylate/guanylate cyclase domain-containing protein [Mycobacterium marinum]|uniref:adenylate/guanylate cyclase domain-containing protein n=1 Tax=Mycobacterium marinum TaxID=1781 RepID=UPI000B96F46F|nr:adenylate/guanylate cyclase domain-containing protein [Mycobacterium marinum]MDC8993398.1 adenylate/guanylate cyclase domain-containing protein [Mycobacterium marinum]MDC9015019.1 adenylate/guanylate cyclase domain-containing protein [Mycobacterium marinum]WDZ12792.1 adenylate/guanylate cyclase domain-containing protein [Mycobacterium marinum]